VLHVVHDEADRAAVWVTVAEAAASESYQLELIEALGRDAEAFNRKLLNVLAEVKAVLRG
jgi:hypothetical protein